MTASEGDGNGWVVSAGGDRRWGRFGAAGLLLRAADPTDPDTPLVLLQHRAVWTASGDTWALPGGARDSYEDAPRAALRETEEEAEIRPADVVVRAEVVTSRMPGTVWHRPGLDMRHAAEMLRRLRPDQRHDEEPDESGADAAAGAAGADVAAGADRRPRALPPLVQESPDSVEWTYTTVIADAEAVLETVPNRESAELRWVAEDGAQVAEGERLAVLEAMKPEMPVEAPGAGVFHRAALEPGAKVAAGTPLGSITG